MTTANPLVKRCYTMSEPHLSGHRVILGFNTMKEAQDAHDFIASIRPSPADSPCQSAGAVASGECGSVPFTSNELDLLRQWFNGVTAWNRAYLTPDDKALMLKIALLQSGMQPPNNQPNSDHVAVIGAKPDSVHLAVTSAEPETRVVELRVWWIPQVPGKAFYAPAESVGEASNMLAMLASYDQFQLDNNIKPDYCNAGGLEVFEDGEWTDWYSEDGETIDEFMRAAQSGIKSKSYRPNEQNDFRCMEIGCGSTTEGVHHQTCPEAAAGSQEGK